MPMTLAILFLLLFAPTRDRHECRADDSVVQAIRLLMLLDDRALGLLRGDVRDRLVKVGVERRTERVDRFEALALEDCAGLGLCEPRSCEPVMALEIVGTGREGAVVSVKYVKSPCGQVRLRQVRRSSS